MNKKILIIILVTFLSFTVNVNAMSGECGSGTAYQNDHECPEDNTARLSDFDSSLKAFLDSKSKSDVCNATNQTYICAKTIAAKNSGFGYVASDDAFNAGYISSDNCINYDDQCYIDECTKTVSNYCKEENTDSCSQYQSVIEAAYKTYSDAMYNDCKWYSGSDINVNDWISKKEVFCNQDYTEQKGFKIALKNSQNGLTYCASNNCDDAFYLCAKNYCETQFDENAYTSKCTHIDGNGNTVNDKLTASGTMISINKLGTISCSSIKEIVNFFDGVYVFIEVIGALLLIVMTLLNFMKVVASDKADDEMKKAKKNFVTRIIIMGIIFLLPIIVKLLINAVGGSTCYIG